MSGPPDSEPDESDSSIDPDSLVSEFIDLQTRLYTLKPEIFDRPKGGKKPSQPDPSKESKIQKIQRKISKVENDVLYDPRETEPLWRERLEQLRKEAVYTRHIARESAARPPPEPEKQEQSEEQKAEEANDKLIADIIGEDDNADILGDMFQTEERLFDQPPDTAVVDSTKTIRDFGTWAGLSPRRILEEACRAK